MDEFRDRDRAVAARCWHAAQAVDEAVLNGIRIDNPYGMAYPEDFGVYTYAVAASNSIPDFGGSVSLGLDGDTGALVDMDLSSGLHAAKTIETGCVLCTLPKFATCWPTGFWSWLWFW